MRTYTVKQMFSVVDGRLSTSMDDVYDILNESMNTSLFTHMLPSAMQMLKQKNPAWYAKACDDIKAIKEKAGTNDFERLMDYMDRHHKDEPLYHVTPIV